MYRLDRNMRYFFIVLLIVPNQASNPEDVLNTREAMAVEAQKGLTASFIEYETKPNTIEQVCIDVGGTEILSLPDLCMPDSEYDGSVRVQPTDESGEA